MSNTSQWYINQKVHEAQQSCRTAVSRLQRARNLRELAQAEHVHVESYVRCLVSRELGQVRRALESRGRELVDATLEELRKLPPAERLAAIGSMRVRDWNYLRGILPGELRRIEMELVRLQRNDQSVK